MPAPGSNLIVPLNLEVLVINNDSVSSAMPASMQFQNLPFPKEKSTEKYPYLGEAVLTPPMSGQSPLEMGNHLHWALPAALTKGIQENGRIIFPPVPDRWLITRVWIQQNSSAKPHRQQKSWIIESNYLSDEIGAQNRFSNAIPVERDSNNTPPYTYLGRVCDAATWQENANQPEKYYRNLTAVGMGIPEFAAYYPNCRNVFGFYDDLTDLKNPPAQISYIIIGWHSPYSTDPLSKVNNLEKKLDELGWTVVDKTASLIESTLYYGFITEVMTTNINDPLKQPSSIKVAVGPNSKEALSALLAEKDGHLEDLLNAVQINFTGNLDDAENFDNFLTNLHQHRFRSPAIPKTPASKSNATEAEDLVGKLWIINRTKGNSNTVYQFDIEAIKPELEQLNNYQHCLNSIAYEIQTKQAQLFADWCKYLAVSYSSDQMKVKIDQNNVKTLLQNINDDISSLNAKRQDQIGKIKMLQSNISQKLGNDFELQAISEPRYFYPTDPALLLTGETVAAFFRNGQFSDIAQNNKLLCRLTNDLINSITLPANAIYSSQDLAINASESGVAEMKNLPYSEIVQTLLSEVSVLDQSQLYLLISSHITLSDETKLQNIKNYLKKILANPESVSSLWHGQLPNSISRCVWAQPWLPLLMHWRIKYNYFFGVQPDNPNNNYDPDFILKSSQWDDNLLDLKYNNQVSTHVTDVDYYLGSTFLTPSAPYLLKSSLDNYLNGHTEISADLKQKLKKIRTQLEQLPLLSQSLGGLTSAYLTLQQTLQLQVKDPYADGFAINFVSEIANTVANQNKIGPTNSTFSPVIAGKMEIDQLRIVDVFGRLRDYVTTQFPTPDKGTLQVVGAKSTPCTTEDQAITIPPRLAQPARVLFRWLAPRKNGDKDTEQLTYPSANPVIGWILTNHVDNSLVIYTQEGVCVGSIILDTDEHKLLWQGSPANAKTFDKSIQEISAIASNPDFIAFVNGIFNNGPDFFEQLLDVLDTSASMIEPSPLKGNKSQATLFGRPFAIVRTLLSLELAGIAAINQSWKALADDLSVKNSTSAKQERTTNKFTEIKFPVHIGKMSHSEDGLVGYFIEKSAAESYSVLYSEVANNIHGVMKPTLETLTLQPQTCLSDNPANSYQQVLTLIIDPHTPIHASMGMQPVKSLQLYTDQYQSILEQLSTTFRVAPIIASENETCVLSNIVNKDLAWVSIDSGGSEKSPIISPINKSAPQVPFSNKSVCIKEGWLQISQKTESTTS